jgi:AcrR family transcriptional regulator
MERTATARKGRSRATTARGSSRLPRADARRNRARVLEVAIAVFAADGLSVPIHEIARRAGVGTGTVSRHFPTKEVLYEAIVHDRTGRLVQHARALMAEEPGKAFFVFFSAMVNEFAINAGLVDALAGAGFDVEAAASSSEHDVIGALRQLLTRAKKAGAVRKDVDVADVKSLILACCTRARQSTDDKARRRMVQVVCQGLRPS